MRTGRIVGGSVLLLALAAAAAGAEPERARPVNRGVDIDLGSATLAHREIAVGPLHVAGGLFDRAMVGTYLLPWSVALLDGGSVIPNAFAKLELGRRGRFSAAAETSGFYARLNDLDGDGLNARAVIWPSRVLVAAKWDRRWSTTVSATGVYVAAVADNLQDQDTQVHGVALANTFHTAFIHRFRLTPGLTLWARARLVLRHSPVRVTARAPISDSARIRVEARANSAELSSAGGGTLGLFWARQRLNLRAGVGYGHWILPWIQLPLGRRMVTGDLNLYWRF